MNLKGVKALSKIEQKAIHGGNAGKCSDSCSPPSTGQFECYHSNDCLCPGVCTSQGCQPI